MSVNQLSNNQLIQYFAGLAAKDQRINTFGYGPIYDVSTGPYFNISSQVNQTSYQIDTKIQPTYPLMWVEPVTSTLRKDSLILRHKIHIVDLVEKDLSNRYDVMSDSMRSAMEIKAFIFKDFFYDIFPTDESEIEPVWEKFDDELGGVSMEVDLQIDWLADVCNIPGLYPSGTTFNGGPGYFNVSLVGYLPLAGGVLSGPITGTCGYFSCFNATALSGSNIFLSGVSLLDTFLGINAAIGSATTIVQNGLNTYTGGTILNPTINISGGTVNNWNVTGGTLSSGGTNLYNIFALLSESGGTSGNLWSASTGLNSIIANNGTGNLAAGNYSIVGGQSNTASAGHSFIGGGKSNLMITPYGVIVGGYINNLTYGAMAFMGGGGKNLLSSQNGIIVGGYRNSGTSTQYSIIVGGKYNLSSSNYATIVGGYKNRALATHSFIGGGKSNSGTGYNSVIVGGGFNYTKSNYSSVGGGFGNYSSNYYAVVAGGKANRATGTHSFIGGGYKNQVSNNYSSVLGGKYNMASGLFSSVLAGQGITGASDNTAYVPHLNIQSATTDETINNVLVKDSFGEVKLSNQIPQLLINDSSSGVIAFSGLSINADTTKFNVGGLQGWFIDNFSNPTNPSKYLLIFSGQTGITDTFLTASTTTYVGINSAATIVQQSTPFTTDQHHTIIPLGVLAKPSLSAITIARNLPVSMNDGVLQLNDLMNSLGIFNISGNLFSANAANLKINKSSGTLFRAGVNYVTDPKNPHELTLGALVQAQFQYTLSSGNDLAQTLITDINPNIYENPLGSTASTPSNRFTIQRIYSLGPGVTRIQPGQNLYTTLANALQALAEGIDTYSESAALTQNGLLRCYLIVRGATTDLTNSARAMFLEAPKFPGGSAAGSLGTTTLQQAYDNSLQPQIVTDSLGAIQFQNGNGADSNDVIEILNSGGTKTSYITGDGSASFSGSVGIGINPTHQFQVQVNATDNIFIDGRTNPRQLTLGVLRLEHTPAITGTRPINIDVNASGISDTHGIVIDYKTGSITGTGFSNINETTVDVTGSSGLTINSFFADLINDSGYTIVNALKINPGINPIYQLTGNFVNSDKSWSFNSNNSTYTDVTTGSNQLFAHNGDIFYIGKTSGVFNEAQIILSVVSSTNILPTFQYWNGSTWTNFSPTDGTNGFLKSGNITFIGTGLTGWASTSVNGTSAYYIRATRTKGSVATPPTESSILINVGSPYSWNKTGDLNIGTVTSNSFTKVGGTSTQFLKADGSVDSSVYATTGSCVQAVQPGSNISTGGTVTFPIVNLVASPSINNLTFSGTATGNALSATTVSGGTLYSGSTNLYQIFATTGSTVSLSTTQIAFGSASSTITGSTNLTYNDSTKFLLLNHGTIQVTDGFGDYFYWSNGAGIFNGTIDALRVVGAGSFPQTSYLQRLVRNDNDGGFGIRRMLAIESYVSNGVSPSAGFGERISWSLGGNAGQTLVTDVLNLDGIWETAQSNNTTARNSAFVFNTMASGTTAESFRIGSTGATNTGGIATAGIDLKGSVSSQSALRIRSGSTVTSPNDGDIWNDGTYINLKSGISVSGNTRLGVIGNKILIMTGTNASVGVGTLAGGTATINTTVVTNSSLIFVSDTGGGVLANIGSLYSNSITGGTGFKVTSTNALDTSNFNWWIIN